jgi:hypothetical protein
MAGGTQGPPGTLLLSETSTSLVPSTTSWAPLPAVATPPLLIASATVRICRCCAQFQVCSLSDRRDAPPAAGQLMPLISFRIAPASPLHFSETDALRFEIASETAS